jgi:hypothetical protein
VGDWAWHTPIQPSPYRDSTAPGKHPNMPTSIAHGVGSYKGSVVAETHTNRGGRINLTADRSGGGMKENLFSTSWRRSPPRGRLGVAHAHKTIALQGQHCAWDATEYADLHRPRGGLLQGKCGG